MEQVLIAGAADAEVSVATERGELGIRRGPESLGADSIKELDEPEHGLLILWSVDRRPSSLKRLARVAPLPPAPEQLGRMFAMITRSGDKLIEDRRL